MGLFDCVDCEYPLPDGKPTPKSLFQTKDFPAPYMDRYTITAAGRLIAHRTDYVFEENVDAPLGMWLRRPSLGDEDLHWHGYLNFYGTDGPEEWREFRAKFTDGQLVEIVECGEEMRRRLADAKSRRRQELRGESHD